MVLLFLPKGGLASTTSKRSPGSEPAHRPRRWARFVAADAVQHHVHRGQARRALHQLPAAQGLFLQVLFLLAREVGVVLGHVVVRGKQKAAGAAGRVADRLAGLGRDAVHHGLDQRTRREVLARAALGVLRVFLQQAFVSIALHVGAHGRPVLAIDQVHYQAAQLGRVLELVLRLAEDQPMVPFSAPSRSSVWR
jgi:hypothetical protein